MKVSKVFEKFLDQKNVEGVTAGTIQFYKTHLNTFINFCNNSDINDISINTYNDYIIYLKTKTKEGSGFVGRNVKLSSRSIHTYANSLRVFLNWSFNNKYLSKNIAKHIKLPRYEKKLIEILSIDQIKSLLSQFDYSFLGRRDLLIVCLMLDCGLRLNEVANLKFKDFDFHNRVIKVFGKGRKERYVPLTTSILIFYNQYSEKLLQKIGNNYIDTDHLFKNSDLSDITRNTIIKLFRRLRKKVGYNLHPHLLRHTFATYFIINRWRYL